MTSQDLLTQAEQYLSRTLRQHYNTNRSTTTMANTREKLTTLGRDPFGRFDYVRRTIPKDQRTQSCAWCGKAGAKFQYGTHGDGLRDVPQFGARAFCSQSCHNSHGVR